jgi:hypothetical protein
VAFAIAIVLIALRGRPRPRAAYRAFLLALLMMLMALCGAVALDWPHLATGVRFTYAALCVLGGAMVYIAWAARAASGAVFVDRVGFDLVALLDGFAVIAALTAGAPGWALAVVGVAGVVIGRRAVGYARERVSAQHASDR